ncbi:30S ribosome-binding factor RbfA [Caulobacter sp. BE254]|jgi:ribosome-binding factor A|uniref:30S ribosome-binding factor RbfA n=1 Tax=Caulobacter sp. BE254 TaxID=2817720 RepID=UPI0028564F7E|nr:30S ribosome-binding factor RbfA [Caulobacter sp. BE254]MDR7115252.1 ribosome-binding factor A [Caulobacter sp. BE254]
MKRHTDNKKSGPVGPSQRQLRAGELIRHALVDILRGEELVDPALAGISVTISEVRMSADLKHAICFVEPLGASVTPQVEREPSSPSRTVVVPGSPAEVVAGLNRLSKFLRGRLAKVIDMKFTPDLKFLHDETFNSATYMDRLFADPRVQQDVRRLSDVAEDEEN